MQEEWAALEQQVRGDAPYVAAGQIERDLHRICMIARHRLAHFDEAFASARSEAAAMFPTYEMDTSSQLITVHAIEAMFAHQAAARQLREHELTRLMRMRGFNYPATNRDILVDRIAYLEAWVQNFREARILAQTRHLETLERERCNGQD